MISDKRPEGPLRRTASALTRLPDLPAALEALGKTPQRDVKIVGYDNNWRDCAWAKKINYLPLATADKMNHLIGKELVRLVMDRSSHQLPPSPQVRPLIPEIIKIADNSSSTLVAEPAFSVPEHQRAHSRG